MTERQARWIRAVLIPRILRDGGRAFAMDGWADGYRPGSVVVADGVARKVPRCGTVACIGGWAQLLSYGRIPGTYIPGETAADILGLTDIQAGVLFHGVHRRDRRTGPASYGFLWPEPYYREYREAETPAAKAQVAARLLERVARTRGRCLCRRRVGA